MDEARVAAAVQNLAAAAYGLYEPASGPPCRMVPVDVIAELVEAVNAEPPDPAERLGPLAEIVRLKARSVRDDHADGARCASCTDDGCPRLDMWSPTVVRLGASLDEPADVPARPLLP